jgi:transcriptional/translational regulatory protein YebC/TACO1
VFEAYGPSGSAIIIDTITDSRNRAVAEVKKILADHEAKWAEIGSVRWAFEVSGSGEWKAKFPQEIPEGDKERLAALIEELLNHDDVQRIATNVIGMELREE